VRRQRWELSANGLALAARIDRLPPEEKHLLQTAAVIGTEASLPLLHTIADVPEAVLHRGLVHLQAAELLSETRLFPEREFAFKHALTHEVAYGSLLLERRRTLHARIIEAMETLYADRIPDHVERLAHHALWGEVWEKAVTYCCQAGTKAFARSAHREAVTCFEQALAALQRLPESRETLEQAIDLRFELRTSLLALGDLGRLLDHLRAAQTLAEALDDARRLGWVLSHLSAYFWQASEHDRAIDAGHQALTLAVQRRDSSLEVTTHVRLGQVYHAIGDYRRAVDVLKRNVASLAGEHNRERFGLPGAASVFSRMWLSWCLAECGAFAEGITQGEAGRQIAEGIMHPYTLTLAYLGIGGVHLAKGDLRMAIARLERGLGLCQVWTLPILFPMVASHVGYAWALAGRVAEALPLLQQAVEQADAMRRMDSHALRVAWLGEAYLLAGHSAEAMLVAQRALELSRAHKERGHEAWTHRLLAEIHAHQASAEATPAEAAYRQALALAEDLGMRPLQAHCHRGLGMLYTKIGQWEPARTALSTAIAMYQSMEMTFWLPETEAALAQVEGR
jgi:tetratricopeptide (TPR) repeat protein